MANEKDERNLVFLRHKFESEHKDGKNETRTSTLCEYGEPKGYSAMAKPVSVPCGLAIMQVLDGKLLKGLSAPYASEVCNPLREELKGGGLRWWRRPWLEDGKSWMGAWR